MSLLPDSALSYGVLTYAQQAMLEAHDKDDAFCDMQGELPF
jgi:hypothetical protein